MDVNFTKEERRELLKISMEVFIEIQNKKYARTYQNWDTLYGEPYDKTGYDCILMTFGMWNALNCDFETIPICANQPQQNIGNKTMTFMNASLIDQSFHIWWYSSSLNDTDIDGLKLNWHIETGSVPDVKELVSKDLEGSVSTPGLGSLPLPTTTRRGMSTRLSLSCHTTSVISLVMEPWSFMLMLFLMVRVKVMLNF